MFVKNRSYCVEFIRYSRIANIATSYGAEPLRSAIARGNEPIPVWPYEAAKNGGIQLDSEATAGDGERAVEFDADLGGGPGRALHGCHGEDGGGVSNGRRGQKGTRSESDDHEFAQSGCFRALAKVSDDVMPGVIASPLGYWASTSSGGSTVNAVNNARFADLGRAPTFSECRVEVSAG